VLSKYLPAYLATHPPTYATYATYATLLPVLQLALRRSRTFVAPTVPQADIKQGMREILVDWIFELRQVWSQ
jgi:hypothetical protein